MKRIQLSPSLPLVIRVLSMIAAILITVGLVDVVTNDFQVLVQMSFVQGHSA